MLNKPIQNITLEDFHALVESGARESINMDFKQFYSTTEPGKKADFLADISAFANTSGGDLIYGIKEVDGVASEVTSFDVADHDQELLSITSLVQEGIEPRIQMEGRFIPFDEKFLLIIRVKKSWLPPHRVVHSGSSKIVNRFFARKSNGNYPMDISEIRRTFVSSETLNEKIASFRTKRLIDIGSDRVSSLSLKAGGKFVLHILPINALLGESSFDINATHNNAVQHLYPIRKSAFNTRINYEGLATYAGELTNVSSYVQLFRNGTLEATESGGFTEIIRDSERYIPSLSYEQALIKSLDRYMQFMRDVGLVGPFSIHLSLLGAKGCKLAVAPSGFLDEYFPIDRDILETPDALVEDSEGNPEQILRPMFDTIWNACGLPRSLNFDEDGNWVAENWRNV
ncbi:MAG: ATP-binding protein [Candidatus Gracilibacteria bacterium]|nr:ATP-binding protein [Candidatus Gracilibacteria bacterium]